MSERRRKRRRLDADRRRAYTLIEMLVVIAATVTLLGIALGILHTLIRLERGSRREVRQRTAIGRLAIQFRRDMHAAEELTDSTEPGSEGAPRAWQLSTAAGPVIEYRVEPEELIRTERTENEILRQESFCLPKESTVSIDRIGEADHALVRLRVRLHGPRALLAMRAGLSVEAQLGKDYRFLQQEGP